MSQSTILDGNSFSRGSARSLSTSHQLLVAKRARLLGPSYRLFYREPLHAVRALGTKIYDAEGVEYLDAYNNVAGVGHANARVAEAVDQQMRTLNTHTRYLQDGILSYAEDYLATMPSELDRVMFMATGSEANDLALRIARHHTGGEGVVVTAEAYHGTSYLTAGASPAMGPGFPLLPTVRPIAAPDTLRGSIADVSRTMVENIHVAADALERQGMRLGAYLADTIFSSDGVYPDPAGFLSPVVDAVHARGGLFIADEVQPGFGRTGSTMWGFQRHDVVPDIVTTGKAMGNGVPISGMAIRSPLIEAFGRDVPYFNTFGGNPVSIAAAHAVLRVIQDEDLVGNASAVGRSLATGLRDLADEHPLIGDVRAAGLYIGAEIVRPGTTHADAATALDIVNEMRARRVLISSAGPGNNVLKIRPPLVFSMADVDRFLTEMRGALESMSRREQSAS